MRPSWDQYFMDQCELVSTRATCDRRHVGAIIVQDKRIIATGYNGSLPGQPHCSDPETYYIDRWGSKRTPEEYEQYKKDHPAPTYQSRHVDVFQHFKKHGGHDMEEGHCVRTVHAEVNAIAQAARLGISTEGATLYCNTRPCWNCFKTIVSAGISEVVYRDEYRNADGGRIEAVAKETPGFILRQYIPKCD